MKILRCTFLVVYALLTTTGCQDRRAASPLESTLDLQQNSYSHKYDVEMSEKGLKIGESIFTMPLSLSELEVEIGKPNRKEEFILNDVYIWDKIGFMAFYCKQSKVVDEFAVILKNDVSGPDPTTVFSGSLIVGDVLLTKGSDDQELSNANFKPTSLDTASVFWKRDSPSHFILVFRGEACEGILSVAISGNK